MAILIPAFVPDDKNGLCYFVLPDSLNFVDASESRCNDLDAELVQFEEEAQIGGFWTLLKNGHNYPEITNLRGYG